MEAESAELKKDIVDLETSLAKAESEKTSKDNQIKSLQDEIANQDEAIAKVNKEKKALDENLKKTQAALQAEEDKVNHLNKLKTKLEGTLDEVRIDTFSIYTVIQLYRIIIIYLYAIPSY